MSAVWLRSAATAWGTEELLTTCTVRPALLNSPSFRPMYRGASATPGGAWTMTVPDAVGPPAAEDENPGNEHPVTRIRPAAAAVTPAARRPGRRTRPPHRGWSGAETCLMALLGGQIGLLRTLRSTDRSARQYPTCSARSVN